MANALDISCVMAIFGGTGDLTHRKLIPAIYNLAHEGVLPNRFAVVCIGRKQKSHDQYRDELLSSIQKHSRFKIKKALWNRLAGRIYYYRLDFNDISAYGGLKLFLDQIDSKYNAGGNRLYYLSVAPAYFETITLNLKYNNMAENNGSWQRLVIEKPFGRNLATAQYLNNVITGVFPEENVFRIDHYLGKEMLQNLMVIRFGNAFFESIWNSRYIENIQIIASETVGVETRAEYYEASGAMRDMVQNHMLQLLALVAMEPPASLSAKCIKDERVKLLQSLFKIGPGNVRDNIIRGQYGSGVAAENASFANGLKNTCNMSHVTICGSNSKKIGSKNGNSKDASESKNEVVEVMKAYRDENGVSKESDTETFVAMRLFVGNFRWGNMPFYLMTGKRLAEKATRIIIEFKSMPEILYFKEYAGMQPNILEIHVEPRECVSFQFNAKKPGTINEITNVKMDFCQNCRFEGNSPEAYERLIADALRDDHTLFTSWEEIESSWSFVDSIIEAWKADDKHVFPNYAAGSWGPEEALKLPEKMGHKWRTIKTEMCEQK